MDIPLSFFSSGLTTFFLFPHPIIDKSELQNVDDPWLILIGLGMFLAVLVLFSSIIGASAAAFGAHLGKTKNQKTCLCLTGLSALSAWLCVLPFSPR